MSTADSQVLACTAATDDIKPEWNQDHGKTKMVTLVIAVFATSISLVGQQFPGFGDSVFLSSLCSIRIRRIFVPLILFGWPVMNHSRHNFNDDCPFSVYYMDCLGYGEYVFPSVPGLGAAFAVHFAYCWKREDSNSSPFMRYSVPTRKISAIGAVVVGRCRSYGRVIPSISPSTSSMSDKVGSSPISGTYSFHEIAEGSEEFIEDGESIPIDANSEDSVVL